MQFHQSSEPVQVLNAWAMYLGYWILVSLSVPCWAPFQVHANTSPDDEVAVASSAVHASWGVQDTANGDSGQSQARGIKRERQDDWESQEAAGGSNRSDALPSAGATTNQGEGAAAGGSGEGAGGPVASVNGEEPLDPALEEEEKAMVLEQARAVNGMVRINNMTWWTTDAEVQAMASEFGQVVRPSMGSDEF